MSTGEIHTLLNGMFALIIVIAAALAVAWVLLLRAVLRGRNAARITLTVLAALWLLMGVPSLFTPVYGGAPTTVVTALDLGLVAIALVLLNHPQAVRFCQQPRLR